MMFPDNGKTNKESFSFKMPFSFKFVDRNYTLIAFFCGVKQNKNH